MTLAATRVDVADIAALLTELSQVQTELLDVLKEKQLRMASNNPDHLASLAERELALAERLQECHDKRSHLLEQAGEEGLPSDSITSLASAIDTPRGPLGRQVKDAVARTRLLQHHSLVNWVLAQRALLHVAQLLEIVATGGRLQPTYGKGAGALATGHLLNSEA